MGDKTVTEHIREKVEIDLPQIDLEEMGVQRKSPYGPGLKGVWFVRRVEKILKRKIEIPSREREGD